MTKGNLYEGKEKDPQGRVSWNKAMYLQVSIFEI